jgi:hypothetical protein
MNDSYQELLTIGECAKRLANTSEVCLQLRTDKGKCAR